MPLQQGFPLFPAFLCQLYISIVFHYQKTFSCQFSQHFTDRAAPDLKCAGQGGHPERLIFLLQPVYHFQIVFHRCRQLIRFIPRCFPKRSESLVFHHQLRLFSTYGFHPILCQDQQAVRAVTERDACLPGIQGKEQEKNRSSKTPVFTSKQAYPDLTHSRTER